MLDSFVLLLICLWSFGIRFFFVFIEQDWYFFRFKRKNKQNYSPLMVIQSDYRGLAHINTQFLSGSAWIIAMIIISLGLRPQFTLLRIQWKLLGSNLVATCTPFMWQFNRIIYLLSYNFQNGYIQAICYFQSTVHCNQQSFLKTIIVWYDSFLDYVFSHFDVISCLEYDASITHCLEWLFFSL